MIDHHDLAAELAQHVLELEAALRPGSTGGGRSSGKPGSRPPLRVDVLDQALEVATLVDDVALRLRDALRIPHRQAPTLTTLAAIPALVDALPYDDPLASAAFEALEEARRHSRAVLALDPPLLRLAAACPECFGVRVPLLPRQTLVADAQAGEVWCRNGACGYECGLTGCWCAGPAPRLHRYRWGRADLLRLGQMLDDDEPAVAS